MHERSILIRAAQEGRDDVPLLICCLQDAFELYTVLEYAPCGTIWQIMESRTDSRLPEDLLRHWMAESLIALDWLHSTGWVHRDVKPHNLLLDARGHVKLTDFGSAAPLSATGKVPAIYSSVVVGTIVRLLQCKVSLMAGQDYISPEVLLAHQRSIEQMDDSSSNASLGEVSVTTSTDWWAVGVVLYEGLFGEAPFYAEAVADTYDNILNHAVRLMDAPD
jgi:serine/threonine protein kinase